MSTFISILSEPYVGPMVLTLSDLYQEYFNTTYGNLTQYTAVITARSSQFIRLFNYPDISTVFLEY